MKDLQAAKRELDRHLRRVGAAFGYHLKVLLRLKEAAKFFVETNESGDSREILVEFIEDRRPWSHEVAVCLGKVRERYLEKMDKSLLRLNAEHEQIKVEIRGVKARIRDFADDLEMARELAIRNVEKAEEKLELTMSDLEGQRKRLAAETMQFEKRQNIFLRNTDKTEDLRHTISGRQLQIGNLEQEVERLSKLVATRERKAKKAHEAVQLGENHPEYLGLHQHHHDLILRVKTNRDAHAGIKKSMQSAMRKWDAAMLNDLETAFTESVEALNAVIGELQTNTIEALSESDPMSNFEVHKTHCQELARKLEERNNIGQDPSRLLDQKAIIDSILAARNRRVAAEKKDAEKRKRLAEKRRIAATKEQERKRRELERLERMAVAREGKRIDQLRASVEQANRELRQFDSANRRLSQRLDDLRDKQRTVEARIERVLKQLEARNHKRDVVQNNPERFPSYDNARAALLENRSAQRRLESLITQRKSLVEEVKEREGELKASIQAQRHMSPRGQANVTYREINTWEDAEALAEEYMRALGFTDAQRTGSGSDGGVDVESRRAVAQVKDQSSGVGRGVLQQLFGVAQAEGKLPYFFARHYSTQAVEWGLKNRVKMYQFDLRGNIKEVIS